jgi:hypothetical protein
MATQGGTIDTTRWEWALRNSYLLKDNVSLIHEVTPALKRYLLGLKGKDYEELYQSIHEVIDFAIKPRPMMGYSKPDPATERMIGKGPVRIRKRKAGNIVAEVRGKNFLIQINALRINESLPTTLAESCVGKTIAEIVGDLGSYVDHDRKVIGYFNGFGCDTVFKLDPIPEKGASLTYRELFGDPAERFAPKAA